MLLLTAEDYGSYYLHITKQKIDMCLMNVCLSTKMFISFMPI